MTAALRTEDMRLYVGVTRMRLEAAAGVPTRLLEACRRLPGTGLQHGLPGRRLRTRSLVSASRRRHGEGRVDARASSPDFGA